MERWVLESGADLARLARLLGLPPGRFALEVVAAEGRERWLLSGLEISSPALLPSKAQVEGRGDTRRLRGAGCDGDWPLVARREGSWIHLFELHRQPSPAPPARVAMRFEGEVGLRRIVAGAYELGARELRWHRAEDGAIWLRAEGLSLFLLRLCEQEQLATVYELLGTTVGRAAIGRAWGWRHPLDDELPRLLGGDPDELRLLGSDGAVMRLRRPRWRDIAEAVEWQLELSEPALGASEEPLRLRLPMRWEGRSRPRPASLWWLEAEDIARLEGALCEADAEDLEGLQVCSFEDEGGAEVAVLRRRRGAGLAPPGLAMSAAPQLPQLFWPADQELLPHLRRDELRALLGARGGSLTLARPGPGGVTRVAQVPEGTFKPLSAYVERILAREAVALRAFAEELVFDLDAPLQAFLPPKAAPQAIVTAASPAAPAPEVDAPAGRAIPAPEPIVRPPLQAAAPQGPEDERRQREAMLERRLLEEGWSAEGWGALRDLKLELGRFDDAADCELELAWLERQRRLAAIERLRLAMARAAGWDPEGDWRELPESATGAALLALRGVSIAGAERDAWLELAVERLQRFGSQLRKSLRWLAWGAVVSANNDARAQQRAREAILDDLDEAGVGLGDWPECLQQRLSRDRWASDEALGLDAARANLRAIELALRAAPPALRSVGLALLAGAWERLGDQEPSEERLREALRGRSKIDAGLRSLIDLAALQHPGLGAVAEVRRVRNDLRASSERLPGNLREVVEDVAETLDARHRSGSAASFLAERGRRSLFATGGALQSESAIAAIARLDAHMASRESYRAVEDVEAILALSREPDRDLRERAWLIGELADRLGGRRWEHALAALARLAREAPRFDGETDAYGFIGRALGARLLAELGEEALAETRLLASLPESLLEGPRLDLVDLIKSAALPALEALPIRLREAGLRLTVELLSRSARDAMPRMALVIAQVLDQAVETAISRERIALRWLRRIQDAQEAALRGRISQEDWRDEALRGEHED